MPESLHNTPFAQTPHYSYFNRITPLLSAYYTYHYLSYCLKTFQEDVIKIKSDDKRIHLGDTRYLTMISLIASSGSPFICKELAGHEDVNISARYYSNISRFFECATHEMCKKQKAGHAGILNRKLTRTCETVPINDGRCDSPEYIAGNISDCIRGIGLVGELWQCGSYPHFIDGKTGHYRLFSNVGERKMP